MADGEEISCSKRCRAKVRGWDEFGVPVQLNINKDATHKSFAGGICSIFAFTIMLAFISTEVAQLLFVRSFSQGISIDVMSSSN